MINVSLASDFLRITDRLASTCDLPPVVSMHIPPVVAESKKQADFGLMVLEDGSCGLFYTMLESQQLLLSTARDPFRLIGQSPAEIARWYRSSDVFTGNMATCLMQPAILSEN